MDETRRTRLDVFLAETGLESVWFARPNSFAWLTRGDNVVDRDGDVGVAAAGYDGDGLQVVTNDIEADRLRDEELPADATVREYPWFEQSLGEAVADVAPTPAGADFDVPGFERVNASPLRRPLTETDVETYRSLGADAAAAVESVARDVTPTDTEQSVATDLKRALAERGIESPVVLVGGEERAQAYRHYTPKAAEIGGYALLSVTAQRAGLYASTTRVVAFDPPAWLAERTTAAGRVQATALAATRSVGRNEGTAGDVFAAIREAYDALGWDGEWREHHQGGAAGFAGREWIATPDHEGTVDLPMAYAWNPTVQGAKSEDTVLVTSDGFEPLTSTGEWPTETVSAVGFDVELSVHGILDRS